MKQKEKKESNATLENEVKERANTEQNTQEPTTEPVKETETSVQDNSKVLELEDKLAQSNDKYIRLAAEFDNFRRRSAKERLDLINFATEDVIVGFLPILDDCERALAVLNDSHVSEAAKEGTELIYSKILSYLKSKGVALIDAKNKELDTDYHEAVAQFPVTEKKKKNKIIDIVQNGYTLNGKVIRYAKVVVGV